MRAHVYMYPWNAAIQFLQSFAVLSCNFLCVTAYKVHHHQQQQLNIHVEIKFSINIMTEEYKILAAVTEF